MKSHSRSNALQRLSAGLALALAAAAYVAAGLPAERQEGGVSYVSGGVSDEEAAAFKAMRSGYPLTIELTRHRGGRDEYTANAQVRVIDGSGKVVLDATADGPFMLVRVPPGSYHVQAMLNGQIVESKPLRVDGDGSAQTSLSFRGD